MPNPNDYEWIYDELSVAGCVTVVAGAKAQDVLGSFGADSSSDLTEDDLFEERFEDRFRGAVAVVDIPGGAVAVESNGYQGSIGEVLVRLSELGPVASIFWNVEDDNAFTCAKDGVIVAMVDMYDADEPDDVDLPADLMALFRLAGDDGPGVSMWAVGMAMVEAFTSVPVAREAVASARPFYGIPG